nr:DUF2690 domain-containing protein [Streptomyces tardus]
MTNTGPADLRKRPGRPEWPESWPVPEDDERGPVRTDAARTAASTADALPGATADRPDPAFANFGRSGTFDDAGRAGVRDGRPAESEDGRPAGSPADGRPSRPEWSARLSGVPARPPEGYESTTVLRRSGGGAGAGSYAPAAASPAAGRPAPPGPPGPPAPASDGGRPPSKGRRTAMMLAGAVGALAVIAGAVFLLDLGGGDESAKPEASASPSEKRPELPDGVKCVGEDCAGEDPELMGCGGQYAETTSEAMVGNAYVEVRYSKVCNAAWARVGTATPGTTVTVEAGGSSQDDEVADSNSAYTKMVAAKSARAAEACVETAGGLTGCTNPTP